jgi:hypothetical protein
MTRTLFAVGLALMVAVGCGSSPTGTPGTTYTLASAEPLDVPPGKCQLAWGPEQVGTGTMFYAVDDLGPGNDQIESIIIADSFYLSYACYFDVSTQALTDDRFYGSHQSTGQVIADSYDFIVICHNPTTDCLFNLTWTATY